MESTYIVYNIVPFGFMILLIYIFIDVFLDYFRQPKHGSFKRIQLYSFIFYVLSLIQVKIGGVTFPLQNEYDVKRKFVSIDGWYGIYDTIRMQLSIENIALIYNFLLFIPLGLYLWLLFDLRNVKKAAVVIISSCLIYSILHFTLHSFGLVFISFSYLSVIFIFLNIMGAITGFLLSRWIKKDNLLGAKLIN